MFHGVAIGIMSVVVVGIFCLALIVFLGPHPYDQKLRENGHSVGCDCNSCAQLESALMLRRMSNPRPPTGEGP